MTVVSRSNIMLKHLKLSLITTFILFNTAYAGHVLPVFGQAWYGKAVEVDNPDLCISWTYIYYDKYTGNSAQEVATQILSNPPPHNDCIWGPVVSTGSWLNQPTGFIGNPNDWNAVVAADPSGSATLSTGWQRNCIDSEGWTKDKVNTSTLPYYICPTGYIVGNEENNFWEFGCTNTPMPCNGDVVGRDLDSPIFTKAGHIAIVHWMNFLDPEVIQVLRRYNGAGPGIYTETIDQFRKDTEYWGAKYGLPDMPTLDITVATNIYQAASNQEKFPFEYSWNWTWHPGSNGFLAVYDAVTKQWQKIYSVTSAKFRCDSFVYYSYLAGANLHIIPNFEFPATPETLFFAFLSDRDADSNSLKIQPPLQNNNNDIGRIDTIFSSNTLNVSEADLATEKFVKDESIPRQERINQLWNLALKYQHSSERFGYLMDCLDYLKPLELSQQMIQLFPQQSSENQLKILGILSTAIHYKKEPVNLSTEQLHSIISVQNFFQQLLYKSNDEAILSFVIQIYPSMVLPDEAEAAINASLARKKGKLPSLLTPAQQTFNQLTIAFSTQESQEKYLPQLLRTTTKNDERLFLYSLCFMLDDMPSSWINEKVRMQLKEFLEAKKSLLQDSAKSSSLEILNCNWLGAYGTVSTHEETEKYNFMLTYIKQHSSPMEQAILLSKSNQKFIAQLNENDRKYFRDLFRKLLIDNNITKQGKEALVRGINILGNSQI